MDFLPSLCLSTGCSHIMGGDAAHGGPCWRRYPHCSPRSTPCCSRWIALKDAVACGKPVQKQAPGWSCGLWSAGNARAGFVARTEACRGCRLKHPAPEGLYSVGGNPHCNRRAVWGGGGDRENVLWTDCNPHFCTAQREEVTESGEALSLGRSKVGGSIGFISHHLLCY